MKNRKVIYYTDELNDEFSTAKIKPRIIDGNYKYTHNKLWEGLSYLFQNIFTIPIKVGYSKLKFKLKYVGKEKLNPYKKQGYFIFSNHTQAFADTFISSMAVYPKRNFFIVHPANVSMKVLGNFVQMLGAIPLPDDKIAWKNFLNEVGRRIQNGSSVTIFPEAHIWPYYTQIRPFVSTSFKYAVDLDVPVFTVTNTYKSYGKNKDKVQIITYIDGPFFPNKEVGKKEAKEELRNKVYETMCNRSKLSDIEVIQYVKK